MTLPHEFAEAFIGAEKFGNALFEFMGIPDPANATKEQRLLWLKAYVACVKIIHGPSPFKVTTKKVLDAYREAQLHGLIRQPSKAPN